MTTPPPAPYLTRSQYAAHIKRSPGYITQLAGQGRVVFTPDGRFVDVAKTTALIATTADPAKQPVADRHAAAREQASPGPYAAPPAAQAPDNAAGSSYQQARAVKERYQALDAKRAYEVAIGQLRDAREVEHAVATAFTELRLRLENLATTLAPELSVATDEARIRATLQDHFARALEAASHHFARLAAGVNA